MILANLKEMKKHELGKEYEHINHKWINQELSCGCVIAICTDVKPTNEEIDFVSKHFTKINNLQAFIRETMNSNDSDIKKRFTEFRYEQEATQLELKEFINTKREEYKLPNFSDFNSEYYMIKIKQDPNCRNGNY